jgi:hypothetical protein
LRKLLIKIGGGASYEKVVNAGGSADGSVGGSWPQWGGAAKPQKK